MQRRHSDAFLLDHVESLQGARHGYADRLSFKSLVLVIKFFVVLAASVLIGIGIGYLVGVAYRLATGDLIAARQLAVFVGILAMPSVLGGVHSIWPEFFGYRFIPGISDGELRAKRFAAWMKALLKSGLITAGLIFGVLPPLSTALIAVAIWFAWLLIVVRPMINRMTLLECDPWPPDLRSKSDRNEFGQ